MKRVKAKTIHKNEQFSLKNKDDAQLWKVFCWYDRNKLWIYQGTNELDHHKVIRVNRFVYRYVADMCDNK